MTTVPREAADAPSFGRIYEAHRQRVYRWALRYGAGNPQWAEDLTHDVFMKALEQFERLENPHDLGGWLYRVTANLAISRIRSEQSIFGRVVRLYRAGRDEAGPSPQALLELRDDAARALEALQRLPARERVALVMTVLDGKSQREVARELSLSEGYVSKLLKRAWASVRASGWGEDDG